MSNWPLVESIVDRALELSADKRTAFIDRECGDDADLKAEVLSLLSSIHESGQLFSKADDLKKQAFQEVATGNPEPECSLLGTVVGKYKICELISHGGMGTVFLAERNDGIHDQKVALKLIRHGMETPEIISRFEKERYILGGLNHPNIAKLFDGGVTESGLPYLVMEYIDGEPIDEYCDRHKLSISERLALFQKACKAVQYAHNNLVIHRDLKPANLLVDQNGEIKILDFGIAKLLEEGIQSDGEEAETTQQILTPGYAAPEQVAGQSITTATDTYTLGVLLYRLLCGTPPFDFQNKSIAEKQNAILNEIPQHLSNKFRHLDVSEKKDISRLRNTHPARLRLELKGDLDAILSKALRKESCRRYQTCESLMDDITRFRSNLPVNAHQGSFAYKTEKFLKRNYKSLSAIAAIMIISVLFSLYHTNRITEERNLARFEAERTAEVTSMLYDLFEANEPEQTLGDTITAHELLQRGLERAESMHGQPELQAQTFNVIGRIYLKLGNLQKAEPILADAVDIMENLYGPNHSDTAEAYASLASILSAQGQYPEAEAIFNHSIEVLESYSVLKASVLSSAMTEMAYVLRRQGKYSEAEDAYRRNVERFSEQYGVNHPKTISAENGLGVTVFNQGNYSEAERIFSSVLNKRIQLFGDTHPDVAESKNSLGALYMNLGRFRESEQLFQEALFLRNRILGPRHPKTLLTLNNLAINQRDNGKFDLSGKTFQRVIEYKEELFGPYSVASAISYFSYGELKLLTQQPSEAIDNFEKALPVFEDFLGEQHSFSARTRMNIGYAYLKSGNRNLAKIYLEDGYEQVAKIHETNTLERAIADHQMGSYHMHRGDYQQAYELIHQSYRAFTSLESSVSARHRQVINDLNRISQYASAE